MYDIEILLLLLAKKSFNITLRTTIYAVETLNLQTFYMELTNLSDKYYYRIDTFKTNVKSCIK